MSSSWSDAKASTSAEHPQPPIFRLLGTDELETILSHLGATALVMAERTSRGLCQPVRGSSRVWHTIALQHAHCPTHMLDAEKRTDWRFWRGVVVAAASRHAPVTTSLLDGGLGLCSSASSCLGCRFQPNNVLLDSNFDYWSSRPHADGASAIETLTFHTLFESHATPTADEAEYLGCLISEVRITPHQTPAWQLQLRRAPGQPLPPAPVFAPLEACVAFECRGETTRTARQLISPIAEEQTICTFDPPLLLSPGMAPGYGALTITLFGTQAPPTRESLPPQLPPHLPPLPGRSRMLPGYLPPPSDTVVVPPSDDDDDDDDHPGTTPPPAGPAQPAAAGEPHASAPAGDQAGDQAGNQPGAAESGSAADDADRATRDDHVGDAGAFFMRLSRVRCIGRQIRCE